MIKDLERAIDRVEFILNKYPSARDCDKTLWLGYLVLYHDLKNKLGSEAYTELKEIIMDKNTCTMESVRRTRQKFQEHGKYVGSKRAAKLAEAELVKQMMK